MINISLKDVVLTGNFGPVKIGMHRDDLVKFLGEPETEQNFGTGFNGLLYSWYEFFYYTDSKILSSFQNDHLMARFSNHRECINFQNEKFKIDLWFLEAGKNFTFSQVKGILSKENINFIEIDKGDYMELLFESGVTMDFECLVEDSVKEEFMLNGIRNFPDLRRK